MKKVLFFAALAVFGVCIYLLVPKTPARTKIIGRGTVAALTTDQSTEALYKDGVLVEENDTEIVKAIWVSFKEDGEAFACSLYYPDDLVAFEEQVYVLANKRDMNGGFFAIKASGGSIGYALEIVGAIASFTALIIMIIGGNIDKKISRGAALFGMAILIYILIWTFLSI